MADENLVLESFHTRGGIKNGVLARKVQPTSLQTLTCFTEPEGLYHVENRIEFDESDPFAWTHFVHHSGGGEFVERDRQSDDPADVVPSYAEYVLVQRLLDSGDAELRFTMLDEGSGELRPAVLRHEHDEVGLYAGDKLLNRHRVVGDDIIASDWGGIGSRLVHDLEELLDGLDEQVRVRLRMFLDS